MVLSEEGVVMNNYEDPTKRLYSHNWSKEYQENYDKIFGKDKTDKFVVLKISYLSGDTKNKIFHSMHDAGLYLEENKDTIVNWIEL